MRRTWRQDGCLDLFFLFHPIGRSGDQTGDMVFGLVRRWNFVVSRFLGIQDVKFVDRRCSYEDLGGYEEWMG
jgi:hypothetical protein